jgi:hypothetical protein
MPSPNRRLRAAVYQRRRDLRRLVERRVITEGEASQILQMYRLKKFYDSFRDFVLPKDFKQEGIFIEEIYE